MTSPNQQARTRATHTLLDGPKVPGQRNLDQRRRELERRHADARQHADALYELARLVITNLGEASSERVERIWRVEQRRLREQAGREHRAIDATIDAELGLDAQ